MERTFHFFRYKDAVLHYSIKGSGEETLLCFHGFGLTGESFYALEDILQKEYTIYNFDIFFHGKSEWLRGEEPLTAEFWSELITEFLRQSGIKKFSMLGFSIGANFVWNTVISFPGRVTELILAAPDGINRNIWYSVATGNSFSRFIFRRLLFNRSWTNSFLKIAKFLKLAPRETTRFAGSQLATDAQRRKVFYTWVSYRKLKPNPVLLAQILNTHKIPLTIYLGSFDRLISYSKVKSLTDRLERKNIITLEAGHSNLLTAVGEYLKSTKYKVQSTK